MATGLDAPPLAELKLHRPAAGDANPSDPPGRGPRSAAFFDLDNTLIQGASLFHLARGLAAHRLLNGRDIARFGWGQLTFRVRGGRAGPVESTRERAPSFVAGRTAA